MNVWLNHLWWSVSLLIIVTPNRGTGHALRLAQQEAEALRLTYVRNLTTSQDIRVQVQYSSWDTGQLSTLQSAKWNEKCVYVCVRVFMYKSAMMRVDIEVMAAGVLQEPN